jgi:predicted PurR-regulated permease PerM
MPGILLVTTLYVFLPEFSGGITLYILTRKLYLTLTVRIKWSAWLTALLFIVISILTIAVPVYFSVQLILPRVNQLINNQDEIIRSLEIVSKKIEGFIGQKLFTDANAQTIAKRITAYLPFILNTTANVVTNFCMMFFFLFYLLYSSKEIEKYLSDIIPLSAADIKQLAEETNLMIRANAIGIPIVRDL